MTGDDLSGIKTWDHMPPPSVHVVSARTKCRRSAKPQWKETVGRERAEGEEGEEEEEGEEGAEKTQLIGIFGQDM